MPWIMCVACRVKPRIGGPRCADCERAERRRREAGRPSPSARGYGRDWQKLRRQILERDGGLCVEPGCGQPATEVDHIVPKHQGGTDDETNLRSLCRAHHATRTGRQRHAIRYAGQPRRG